MSAGTARAASIDTTGIVQLGGIDLSGYCQSLGDQGVSLDGTNAYSWRCVQPDGSHVGFSMGSACQWQFNDSNAVDRVGNFFDPDSWTCFTEAAHLGGADLDGYCRSLGNQGVSLDGTDAYSWRCVQSDGSHVGIDIGAACRFTWKDPGAIERLGNFFNPYSWECWGPNDSNTATTTNQIVQIGDVSIVVENDNPLFPIQVHVGN